MKQAGISPRVAAFGQFAIEGFATRSARVLGEPQTTTPRLTPRQHEVLSWLCEGLPNKLIARRLGISEKTVKTHLTRVFREIGVTDRVQAVLWAERHGIREELRVD